MRLASPSSNIVAGHVEGFGRIVDDGLLVAQHLDRAVPGDGFDAAQVGTDRTLGNDLDQPMSPRAFTWVPPQNSSDGPARKTRTSSPYLSPKKATAPISLGFSLCDLGMIGGGFLRISSLARSSISAICSASPDRSD